ncbi:MAG: hypothetical protein IJA62_03180 [Ruminococcus sp.]|nr:hypothetical protein [Ruminococcus sp.]
MKKIRLFSFFLCLCLIVGALTFGTYAAEKESAPTGNYTYYIETYEQLRNLAKTAQADCRYVLNSDIYQADNTNDLEVVIPAGATFHLDLNGYKIERVTQGVDCALFRIRSGGVMTVRDSSTAHTGYCSFSEGYADYYKAVFINEGGELEILGGYYEIFSPNEQGDCSILRTTSGYTNVYDGTFDSSSAWGGDTISVGHNAYLYNTPYVVIFDGEFFGKYSSIEVSPMGNYLSYGKEYPNGSLHPCVYVLGGNFYVSNGGKDGDDAGFAYCNNGWGRVFVAEGTVFSKCLNSHDQRFLEGTSKEYFTQIIDDFKGGYYKVTAPPLIISEGLDYHYRLINLCKKAEADSYGSSVYEIFKERFDEAKQHLDTIYVGAYEAEAPLITLENRTTDHIYVNWYMCDEAEYNGEDTHWTHLGNIQNVSQWQPEERPKNGASYLLRCVLTNSDLSTYEDIVRLVYEPFKEKTVLSFAEVTSVEAPYEGNYPDTTAQCTTKGCKVASVEWYDRTETPAKLMGSGDTFEAGRIYNVCVRLDAEEGYLFELDDMSVNVAEGTINGQKAITYGSYEDTYLELGFVFAPCEEKPTVTEPTEEITEKTEPAENTTEKTEATENTTEKTDPTETKPATDKTEPTQSTEKKPEPTESTADKTETTLNTEKKTVPSESTGSKPDPSHPVTALGILGDADCNQKVNVKDATAIQKHVASLITLSETGEILADADGNQKVNVKDATAIQKHVAGMNTGYPIGQQV